MNRTFLKEFKNPSNKFRGKPFWSWNGDLDEKELLRQIDIFSEMGFGGYFMHSRVGLETEYLGDKWFDLINKCSDYGYDKGMESYLYDEDRWPSGTAGGIVTENRDFREKYIKVDIFDPAEFKKNNKYIKVYAIDLSPLTDSKGYTYTVCTPYEKGCILNQNTKIAAFSITEMKPDGFYNGYTYVDTMNKEAILDFIRRTHTKYAEKCGDRIGTKIKAIFTDEPHRGPLFMNFSGGDSFAVPYTPKIFEEYEKRFGIELNLPELFFCKNGEFLSPVKWKFAELLQQLFIEGFFLPIKDWCDKHNINLTGHALHEDSFSCQTAMGGSLMRLYPHMNMPGVDVLTRNYSFWIVKQLASAARQTGKETLLSELYGCTGWGTDFKDYKSMGDWQSLFGINLRCPHLSWYTMRGEGKRDYPASIGHQSAWYKDYKYIEDYYARMHTVLAEGKPDTELLVINPIESLWSRVHGGIFGDGFSPNDLHTRDLEKIYAQCFKALSGARIDFDYGDEGLMAEMGSVTKYGQLKIGKMAYKKVLVCGIDTLRLSTVKLLEKFAEKGGTVIFADDIPSYVDAKPSGRVKDLAEKCTKISFNNIPSVCASGREIQVLNNDAPDIFAQTRLCKNERYSVIINTSPKTNYGSLKLCLGYGSEVCELDLRSGNIISVPYEIKDGKIYIEADFPETREHTYHIKTNSYSVKKVSSKTITKKIVLPEEYPYALSEKNIYVMDFVSFKINNGRWSAEYYFEEADKKLRRKLGLNCTGGTMLQPWYIKKYKPELISEQKNIALKYSFSVKHKPKTPVELVIESAENFTVTVNGSNIDTSKSEGKWIDICYDRFVIPENLLKNGKNTVVLSGSYNALSTIEACFVTGDFGVEIKENNIPVITKLPRKLKVGDISCRGLPFYSGKVTYKTNTPAIKGKKAQIIIPEFYGALSKVKSGRKSVMTCWTPNKADITPLITRSGKLDVIVTMTRANTFGSGIYPCLHEKTPDGYSKNYRIAAQGLMASPEIYIYD